MGAVDLVYFDGASNVQKAGACAAEHTTSLLFDNVYNKVQEFKELGDFAKKLRNVFGGTRHAPASMFKKYSKKHNRGISLGFIKPSECR